MNQAVITGINRHPIITVDTGRAKIFEFDENGNVVFELPTHGACFDVWLLPDQTYLYCHLGPDSHGVRIVDRKNNILADYVTESEVFGCQPLPNGDILVGELTQKRLTEVKCNSEINKIIPLRCDISGHEAMRMVRKHPDGTYLVNQPGDRVIRRYDFNGNILQEISTPGNTFAVAEDDYGHIYYTAQTCIIETDAAGNEVWCATREDLAEINPRWLTGMQLLVNGNLIICNWLGHGYEGKGIPLFEINRNKEILWTLEAPSFTGNLANMQVLTEDVNAVCYTLLK